LIAEFVDIGMTISCDDEGIFHVDHWPPLPIDDTVEVQQILKVKLWKEMTGK